MFDDVDSMAGGVGQVLTRDEDQVASGEGGEGVRDGPRGPGPPDFWRIIFEETKSRGLAMTASCRGRLRSLARLAEEAVEADPERRGDAEADLVRFIDRMEQSVRGRGSETVDDEALDDALGACGLWPWCRLQRRTQGE